MPADVSILETVHASTELERACLTVLAIQNRPVGHSELADWLRDAGLRVSASGKSRSSLVSGKMLIGLCRAWTKRDLVKVLQTASHVGYLCHPAAAHALLSAPDQATVRDRVEAMLRARVKVRSYGSACCNAHLGLARLALYRGDTERVRAHFAEAEQTWAYSGGTSPLDLFTGLMHPCSPVDALKRLPEPLLFQYLDSVLYARLTTPEGLPRETLELAWNIAERAPGAKLRPRAFMLRVLGPGAGSWEAALEGDTRVEGLSARAVGALMRGDFDAARARTRDAIEASRALQKRQKIDLDGPLSPLLVLLLAAGEPEDKAVAKALLDARKNERWKQYRLLPARMLVETKPSASALGASVSHPWMQLELLLASAFIHEGESPKAVTQASKLARHFQTVGLERLAAEAQRLAERFGPKGAELAPQGLLAMGRLKRAWELALDALEALPLLDATPRRESDAASSEQRLAFLVSLVPRGGDDEDWEDDDSEEGEDWEDDDWDEGDDTAPGRAAGPAMAAAGYLLAVEARLQMRRKAGWTAGRVVGATRLSEESETLDCLTEADQQVISRIASRRNWNGSRHYFFSSRVALGLVGHPRVFWADDQNGPPVEVVQGQATLVVEREDGGLRIRVLPRADSGGIGVMRDGSGRLVVVELTAAQQSVQRALDALPPIPSEGEQRARQMVDKLSRDFTLHSAIGVQGLAQSARMVEADPRPRVQLARAEPGLRVRLRVAPLGPDGPSFSPAQGPLAVAAEISGEPLRCERDLGREKAAAGALVALCPSLAQATSGELVTLQTLGECLALMAVLRRLGDDVVVVWTEGTPLELVASADTSALRLRLAGGQDWLSASGSLQVDDGLVLTLQQALARRTADGQFVHLDGDRFVALDEHLRASLDALATAAALGKQTGGKKQEALQLSPMVLGFMRPWLGALQDLGADAAVQARLAAFDRAFASTPALPRTLDADLRDYQRRGFEFMARLAEVGAGACLADDMGLGKTLMTLALLLHRAERGPALVVAPTSVRSNWFEEALRFAPTLRLRDLDTRAGDEAPALEAFDVLVVSYTVLAQRIAQLEQVRWATLVLDEAQAVKNATTQRAQAARRLLADARVALTGTPVENHLGDLYSLMSFLNDGLLGSAHAFQETFAKPIQRDGDPRAAAQLKALISPFLLRRRKSEVLRELPPRTEVSLRVEPSEPERAFAEALRRDALARLAQAGPDGASPVTILAEITRLRRAACHPALVDAEVGRQIGSAKLDRLVALACELKEEGHRALVFSQFVGFLQLARERLAAEGLRFQYLDGSTPEAQRRKAVHAFQAGEGDLFLISLKAGGFGLNLTAADYVIHVDPWWNPAVEAQASDRAHRIGQTRPVTIYRLVNAGSIEERVVALHGRKRELAEALLQDSDQPAQLDSAALMALLAGEDFASARGKKTNGLRAPHGR